MTSARGIFGGRDCDGKLVPSLECEGLPLQLWLRGLGIGLGEGEGVLGRSLDGDSGRGIVGFVSC